MSIDKERAANDVPEVRTLDSSNYTPVEKLADQEYKAMILADRKRRMKEFNYNKIYMYNGGYPNKYTPIRGTALDLPGRFHEIHTEFIYTGEDLETDFKVTRHDVETYTRSRKAAKESLEQPKSWHRPEIIEGGAFSQASSFFYTIFLFLGGLFVARHMIGTYFSFRRYKQDTMINTGAYKVSEDGVVYCDN